MEIKRPVVLDNKVVFGNRWLTVIEQNLQLPSGEVDNYYSVKGPSDIVSILALDSNDCVVIVQQYRFAVDAITIDLPGGAVEEGETIEAAARREFAEETGHTLTSLIPLVSFFLDSGQKNSTKHLLLGRFERGASAKPECGMDTLYKPFDELLNGIKSGAYNEPSLILAMLYTERTKK